MSELPVPDLSNARVLRTIAGIRPCRRGGLRLEHEQLGETTIVHNYGQGGCGITLAMGCAPAAADLVEQHGDGPVAVLGAGVVGLASAYELASRGRRVRVIAERVGGDTTSAIAGAIWLPTGLDFPEDRAARDRLNGFLRTSADRLRSFDAQEWGIETLPVYEPAHAPYHSELFESGTIEGPTPIDSIPVGAQRGPGKMFRTLFVHTTRFLRTLRAQCESLGVAFEQRTIGSVDDVRGLDERVVVNCLALGSREVFGDAAMYPARGVLVHLEPQDLGYIVHDGYKYLFPRQDALILGGTFEPGEADGTPPEATVREILAHHRRFFGLDPETGEPAGAGAESARIS
ncbi:MAG: FAD-dependent oxidoreductase [Phycisphaerales bacterium]